MTWTSTEEALRAAAVRYAMGVDRRDPELFLSALHPQARLRVQGTDFEAVGHEQLAAVVDRMKAYDKTFHFVGNTLYDVDVNVDGSVGGGGRGDDTASGEVYGLAHHLSGGKDQVMVVRWRDTYRRDGGDWRISDRTVVVDWTYTVATD
jgi:hypothetical protein